MVPRKCTYVHFTTGFGVQALSFGGSNLYFWGNCNFRTLILEVWGYTDKAYLRSLNAVIRYGRVSGLSILLKVERILHKRSCSIIAFRSVINTDN